MTYDPKTPISKAFETPAEGDEPEVTGHAIKARMVEQPEGDEAEVAGHLIKVKAVEQPDDNTEPEVEGHMSRGRG